MFNFKEAQLEQLAIHFIGNAADEEGMTLSKQLIQIDADITSLLKSYFLKPFKEQELYTFHHESDLDLNEIFHYVSAIFDDPGSLYLQSINIAKHLYESSSHPNIKPGELYISYFDECVINGEVVEVLGIFKSENKDTYLKVYPQGEGFGLEGEQGININKLDKGCLIFNTEKESGFRVAVVDNTNKSNEAQYWITQFLHITPNQDSYYHTKNYLSLCKNFAEEAFPEADKVDKIDLVNNAVEFFSKKESFDIEEFNNEVMQDETVIEKFQSYKNNFQETNDIPSYDEFEISKQAVKQSKKFIKSVIKLDKNFHVYVHGNRQNIVRGFDEQLNLSTYTLYFKEES
ncbi:MAG: nucleoid-associated protein [Cyclobacteriaceae bacterium]|nr:nucleoid-associated protein [Cyclobacteriaceae bacterium]